MRCEVQDGKLQDKSLVSSKPMLYTVQSMRHQQPRWKARGSVRNALIPVSVATFLAESVCGDFDLITHRCIHGNQNFFTYVYQTEICRPADRLCAYGNIEATVCISSPGSVPPTDPYFDKYSSLSVSFEMLPICQPSF